MNVIGYKGTCEDRKLEWQAMLAFKANKKNFSNPSLKVDEEQRRKILDNNHSWYKDNLKLYIA